MHVYIYRYIHIHTCICECKRDRAWPSRKPFFSAFFLPAFPMTAILSLARDEHVRRAAQT